MVNYLVQVRCIVAFQKKSHYRKRSSNTFDQYSINTLNFLNRLLYIAKCSIIFSAFSNRYLNHVEKVWSV